MAGKATGFLLPPDEQDYLAGLGGRRSFNTSQTLCHEGAPAGDVFLIREGRVRIVLTSPDGRELILATRGPGELVGEMAAFDESPRSASVVADEATLVAAISRARFVEAIESRPTLARLFVKTLVAKVRAADQRTVNRQANDVHSRVVGQLAVMSETFREHNRPDVPIRLAIRQTDLADWVGSTRETVARVLGDLRDAGCIKTGRGTVEVLDPTALVTS